jgi:voltage-gated potassium channel Kch
VSYGVMERQLAETLVIVVTLSMIASPLLMMLQTSIEKRIPKTPAPAFDHIDSHDSKVIIAGFGRFGQIVGRVLRMRKIPFTALESSVAQVELLRRFGNKVFYGDASRLELLQAAGAAEASVLVVAIDDVEASVRTAELARRHYPHLKIFARARNRQHAIRLMDLDVRYIIRETLLSSLDMSQQMLEVLGFSRAAAAESVRRFRQHDESTLRTQREARDDEQKLIQSSQLAAKELERLFESDETSPTEPDDTKRVTEVEER